MEQAQVPPALLEKFNANGTPLPFAGNTVICHVDRRTDLPAALKEILSQSSHWSFSRKIALLPPASYHMTVFGGANDKHRRNPGAWPTGVRLGASMEECNAEMQKRLTGLKLGAYTPLRMKISPLPVQDTTLSLRLELEPVDEQEEQKLRTIRDTLSDMMGLRSETHDTFRFHITLGYLTGWLNSGELSDFKTSYAECRDVIAKRVPKLNFGPLEFCTFEDMLHFERRFMIV